MEIGARARALAGWLTELRGGWRGMGGRETVTRSAKPASVAIEDRITQTNTEYGDRENRNLIRVRTRQC
jgi:hypothetical protein